MDNSTILHPPGAMSSSEDPSQSGPVADRSELAARLTQALISADVSRAKGYAAWLTRVSPLDAEWLCTRIAVIAEEDEDVDRYADIPGHGAPTVDRIGGVDEDEDGVHHYDYDPRHYFPVDIYTVNEPRETDCLAFTTPVVLGSPVPWGLFEIDDLSVSTPTAASLGAGIGPSVPGSPVTWGLSEIDDLSVSTPTAASLGAGIGPPWSEPLEGNDLSSPTFDVSGEDAGTNLGRGPDSPLAGHLVSIHPHDPQFLAVPTRSDRLFHTCIPSYTPTDPSGIFSNGSRPYSPTAAPHGVSLPHSGPSESVSPGSSEPIGPPCRSSKLYPLERVLHESSTSDAPIYLPMDSSAVDEDGTRSIGCFW
jgi:hypothetical protein